MPDDEELLLNIQAGETDELALLVERHHSPLLGYLYRMTGGNRTLAEDMVQEAFLRVLKSIHTYTYPRPFKPWLYTIATNLVRDTFRAADSRTVNLIGTETLFHRSGEHPEDALLASDEAREVAAALMRLPDHQREAVVMRYYQDLSLNEISEILDVPLGTVKSRLSLGIKRLREKFKVNEQSR